MPDAIGAKVLGHMKAQLGDVRFDEARLLGEKTGENRLFFLGKAFCGNHFFHDIKVDICQKKVCRGMDHLLGIPLNGQNAVREPIDPDIAFGGDHRKVIEVDSKHL